MSMEVFGSVTVLVVTAIAAFLTVRFALNRLRALWAMWLFILAMWIAAILGILFVDVNVPLVESHFRGGGPAPALVAILDVFFRFAALASVVSGQSKLRAAVWG